MLSFEKIILKSGKLGTESDIPDIHNSSADPFFVLEDSVSPDDGLQIGEGMIKTILPYKMQNGYSHSLYDIEYTAAILENEHLKAVFLPELGGRLWSLYDKAQKRDIIYKNDAVKFGNLAIRNAWFAGGVEWNIGIKGHSPITCEPMFTQRLKGENGEDILKMYAFEEIRGLVYAILAQLKGNELLVKIEIENPNENDTYMYWWSNIAVEQNDDTRFITPASKSFITSYREGGYRISKRDIPYMDGVDTSFSRNSQEAIDYFYDVPKDNKKWIASIDKNGQGLLQFSDDLLIGRKCFMWGQLPGGDHWNKWLTENRDYLEIQAGLRKTQFEHFLMPKKSKMNWIEVYKFVDIGSNEGEYKDVVSKLDDKVYDPSSLKDIFKTKSEDKLVLFGSPRGALEEAIRGERLSESCLFPKDAINGGFKYYLDILEGKETENQKIEFVKNLKWAEKIEEKANKTALDYYLLAIILYANGDVEGAKAKLFLSIEKEEKYYNLLALALILFNIDNELQKGFEYAKKAIALNPNYLPLAHSFGEICIKSENYQAFIDYVASASENIKSNGRIRMYLGSCLISTGKTEEAKKHINAQLVIPDIREGEYSISNIWIELYRKEMARETNKAESDISDKEVLKAHPLPYSIDFRMH